MKSYFSSRILTTDNKDDLNSNMKKVMAKLVKLIDFPFMKAFYGFVSDVLVTFRKRCSRIFSN